MSAPKEGSLAWFKQQFRQFKGSPESCDNTATEVFAIHLERSGELPSFEDMAEFMETEMQRLGVGPYAPVAAA